MDGAQNGGSGTRVRVLLYAERALAKLLAAAPRPSAFETLQADTGETCRRLVRESHPHNALVDNDQYESFVDLIAGEGNGSRIPILAFTRKRGSAAMLTAFARADDVVFMPFTLADVLGLTVPIVPRIRLGGQIEIDLMSDSVRLDGLVLQLTPIQQTLLFVLAASAGEIVSRDTLLATIWGPFFEAESNIVDRHIRELRIKLRDDRRTPRYIETIPGRGYRFRKTDGALLTAHAVPTLV